MTTGSTVLAADINQLENVLQRAAGQTEVGKYYTAGWSSGSGQKVVSYVPSLNRISVPVSVSVDTADTAPSSVNAPSTTHLTANGFAIEATSTGAGTNIGCGGNYTTQF